MRSMTQKEALTAYATQIADSSLFMGHRMSEWVFKAPTLETEIALMNCALDLIGQSRSFYTYAGEAEGKGRSEDDIAYLRGQTEYRNPLISELPRGDWGYTIVKSYYYSVFAKLFFKALTLSSDKQLAAIAERSLKEVTYHVRYTGEWLLRLGDGTQESKKRTQKSVDELWDYVGEMFIMSEAETQLLQDNISTDIAALRGAWDQEVEALLQQATLDVPTGTWTHEGGKTGKMHTEHFEYILAEHQYLQNRYSGCEW